MTDTDKAALDAADRLRAHNVAMRFIATCDQSPYWVKPHEWDEERIQDDKYILADAMLAELDAREKQAAEDALPVGEVWIDGTEVLAVSYSTPTYFHCWIRDGKDPWQIEFFKLPRSATRGQVRRLIAALEGK